MHKQHIIHMDDSNGGQIMWWCPICPAPHEATRVKRMHQCPSSEKASSRSLSKDGWSVRKSICVPSNLVESMCEAPCLRYERVNWGHHVQSVGALLGH
eukprot:1395459-Amphidinium_carterae.1